MAGGVVHFREDRSGSFTPANLKGAGEQDLAKGKVIGVAKLSDSNALGVPAGTYDYVLMKSDNKWHLYAVSGGHVAKEARFVMARFTTAESPTHAAPSMSSTTSGTGQQELPRLVVKPTHIDLPFNPMSYAPCQPRVAVRVQVASGGSAPHKESPRKGVALSDSVRLQVNPMEALGSPVVVAIGKSWADLSLDRCIYPTVLHFSMPGHLPADVTIDNPSISSGGGDPLGSINDGPNISWAW